MRTPGSSPRCDGRTAPPPGAGPAPRLSGNGASPVASATKEAKPGAASASRARPIALRGSPETVRANHSQKRTDAAMVPLGTHSARRHPSGPSGAGNSAGTVTTSTRSASASRAASNARRDSASHRSGATAIQTGRGPGAARPASSRRRRLASAAPRGRGTRPSADAGPTPEPSTSKTRGCDPASRARNFSPSVRALAVRNARSQSPRQRCLAPDAAGNPSSGNARNAPATQNSGRRPAASWASSRSSSARTAGEVMRPPRSKSRRRRAASATAGPPGMALDATATGVRTSHRHAVPAQISHLASSKSAGSRTKPRDAKNAAAAAA